MLTIRMFARLREAAGRGMWSMALPPGIATVDALRVHLAATEPALATALASQGGIRAAVNQQMAGPATPVRDGDEVAFFPPVTGG